MVIVRSIVLCNRKIRLKVVLLRVIVVVYVYFFNFEFELLYNKYLFTSENNNL